MVKEKKKILLVRPDSFSSGSFSLLNWPPLTLLQIAAVTPEEYTVEIMDECFDKIRFDVDVDLVGITFRTLNAMRGYWIADEFRKRGVPVVIGGWHASALPEEAKQHADSVFIGEAESGWKNLLKDFEKGKLKPFYICKPVDGKQIPKPRYNLFNGKTLFYTTQVSRGCPYGCDFCSISNSPLGGRKYRVRPIDDVVEELENVKQKYIIFVDPSLGINVSYTKELFKKISHLNKKIACFINVRTAYDEEFLKLASEAGCIAFSIGFETVSEPSMKKLNKLPKNATRYRDVVKGCHDYGILVLGSFVFGFDEDRKDVFERTIDLIKYIDLDSVGVNILTPFPGTPLFHKMEKEKRLLTKDWSRYNMKDVVFLPKHMTPEELKGGAADVAKEFFSSRNIISRFLSRVKHGVSKSISITYWNFGVRKVHRKTWKWF